jgi:5'-nucleotidase
VEDIVSHYSDRLDKAFNEVIGRSATFLDGERERIRYEETTLGNFVADIMRLNTRADIALLNSGSLRASIDSGPVTLEDIYMAVPFSIEVILLELTGSEIRQALSRSVQGAHEDQDGGFLQVSGISFSVKGHSIDSVYLSSDNSLLDPDRKYRVAVTDFLASGGDRYNLFVDKSIEDTGLSLHALIMEHFHNNRMVSAKIEGRIIRKDQ